MELITVIITIRQRGAKPITRVGLFQSTSAAIVHTLDSLSGTDHGSISAKAAP